MILYEGLNAILLPERGIGAAPVQVQGRGGWGSADYRLPGRN